jgi:4,5-dihydroxyphthalate decarboxylase
MGFEANRKGIELAVQWAFEQQIIPHPMSLDELFDPAMQALG